MFVTTGFLSNDVKTPRSTLGRYVRDVFPTIKPFQAGYKANAGPLLIDGSGRGESSNIGAGIDLAYRIMLDPDHVPTQVNDLFPFNDRYHDVVAELRDMVATCSDDEARARAIWSLGYLINVFRAGPLFASELQVALRSGDFSAEWVTGQASATAVHDISRLWNLGRERFASKMSGPYVFAPTFDLSKPGTGQLIAGEADLIANGTLIELKTMIGTKRSDGSYYDALRAETLYQLIAYVLLDYADAYRIEELSVYSARYGTLHRWPLDEVLRTTAGPALQLGTARQRVWELMHEDLEFLPS